MKTIVLFTASYPYSIAMEDTFLEEELYYLDKKFNIIIVPQNKKGKKNNFIDRLKNVTVLEDLDEFNLWKIKYLFTINKYFLREVKNIKNFDNVKRMFAHYINSKWVYYYIKDNFKKNIFKKDFIFYTFWFDSTTTALSILKKEYGFKLITRVHGGDLYFERNKGYIPYRFQDSQNIDKVIAVSKSRYNYLKNVYKLSSNKIALFYLLSRDYKTKNPVNKDLVFKLVSCALSVKLKRIDKLMIFLNEFVKQTNIKVEFTYIGDGKYYNELVKLKKKLENEKFIVNFLGYKTIDEIMKIYSTISFDYFVLLSETEGGVPFVLREAASCGIPLIGTNVGGIPEIIERNQNGFLVDKFYKDEILDILKKAYELKFTDKYMDFRIKSREIFEEKFSAENNYKKFVKFLERV